MERGILTIDAPVVFDESISQWETHSHQPYGALSYNNNDEIRIVIQNQDSYVLPSQSFLQVSGRLTKTAENAQVAPVTTSFGNNAIAFLFENIKYELNSVEIDSAKNVGITSTMKGYASLSSNQANENFGWIIGGNTSLTNNNGYFDVNIPLSYILGFAEDYKKIVINAKHELILTRTNSDVNAITQSANEEYKITLSKVAWRMPHLKLSEQEKVRMLNLISKDKTISMPFRSWSLHDHPSLPASTRHVWSVKSSTQLEKPRFVILGFQTNRKNNTALSASFFDHCNIRSMKLFLNSNYYPYENMNIDINQQQIALLYQMYLDFQANYYGKQAKPLLTKKQFIEEAPLYIFDCSHQSEPLKSGTIDLKIEFETSANIPANTTAFCLILHDRIIEYNILSNRVQKL